METRQRNKGESCGSGEAAERKAPVCTDSHTSDRLNRVTPEREVTLPRSLAISHFDTLTCSAPHTPRTPRTRARVRIGRLNTYIYIYIRIRVCALRWDISWENNTKRAAATSRGNPFSDSMRCGRASGKRGKRRGISCTYIYTPTHRRGETNEFPLMCVLRCDASRDTKIRRAWKVRWTICIHIWMCMYCVFGGYRCLSLSLCVRACVYARVCLCV